VPESIRFQTKPEIALDVVNQAVEGGVRFRCVVADSGYGDNPAFLDGLEARQLR
jgi:SRSO17 transposase